MNKNPKDETITISPPRIATIAVNIEGTAPLLQLRFSQKTGEEMRAAQEAGKASKS